MCLGTRQLKFLDAKIGDVQHILECVGEGRGAGVKMNA